jgi:hypothetical protein
MGHAQLSDEELMVTIAEGQDGALEALYDRYGGPSYSLALRILGDREAAEEVVQDAFVAVWRKAETDCGAGCLQPARRAGGPLLPGVARGTRRGYLSPGNYGDRRPG